MINAHQKEFISILTGLDRSKNDYEIFSDFVKLAAFSLHNATNKVQELEDRYLAISAKYNKEQLLKFSELLSILINGLESKRSDFLGVVFMELNLGNDRAGQFFTPFEVSKMMASITVGDCEKLLEEKPIVTVQEPACGTGGMVIAIADVMMNDKINYQNCLWVSCTDVDETVALACYIQLALLGIAGEVIIGNALTLAFRYSLKTPFHYINAFETRLALMEIKELQEAGTVKELEPESEVITIEQAEVTEPAVKQEPLAPLKDQIAFDF